jgi:hypothetical protein
MDVQELGTEIPASGGSRRSAPAPLNESQLVGLITKAIKLNYPGAWIMKVHGSQFQTPGIPDLLVCIQGFMVGIEVKHQKRAESEEHARSRTTPAQRIQIQKIIDAGGMAGVALSVEEALDLISRTIERNKSAQ